MTSFFEKNIGKISGRVRAINNLCSELEVKLDFSKPDYENAELIKTEAFQRGITIPTSRAHNLLCRIKRKQAGWKITNQNKENVTA